MVDAFRREFGSDAVEEAGRATASEDFSRFGRAWDVPSVFWFVGGTDPATYQAAEKAGTLDKLPVNHSPDFAPVIDPTLQVGVGAMLAASLAWLGAAS